MNIKRVAIVLVAIVALVWGAVLAVKAVHTSRHAPAPAAVTQSGVFRFQELYETDNLGPSRGQSSQCSAQHRPEK